MLRPGSGERGAVCLQHVGHQGPLRVTGTRRPRPIELNLCWAQRPSSNNTTRGNLGVLTKTGKVIPQGVLVRIAKFAWSTVWWIFMNELAPQSKQQGKYVRPEYSFVCSDVGTFPTIENSGTRYYLLVGNPCPWCHRVIMAARIRNANWIEVVRLVDDAEKASRGGWIFDEPFLGKYRDLREVYDAFCGDEAGFSGRCTAPLLIDVVEQRIVSNESADIIERLDAIHVEGRSSDVRLRPPALLKEIDAFNEKIFDRLNNGVYKCGFSTSQEAYDESFLALCETLDELNELLATNRFVIPGDRFTDADLRVFATIARFDAVYASLFKCVMRVSEYPNIQRWFLECGRLRIPGGGHLSDTVDVDDCRRSYYEQLFPLNPGGLVPTRPTHADVFPAPPDSKLLVSFYGR